MARESEKGVVGGIQEEKRGGGIVRRRPKDAFSSPPLSKLGGQKEGKEKNKKTKKNKKKKKAISAGKFFREGEKHLILPSRKLLTPESCQPPALEKKNRGPVPSQRGARGKSFRRSYLLE